MTITLADLDRLLEAEAPDLVRSVLAFADQDEPWRDDDGGMDLSALKQQLRRARSARRQAQRREQSRAAWGRYLAQDAVAPQLALAEWIERLYARRTGPARQALLGVIRTAPLVFGVWGGLKRVYKRAEADLDAEVFAAISARVDAERAASGRGADVGMGTLVYLSRRAWRFVRQLGSASPELYVAFAVELLRAADPGHDPRYLGTTARVVRSGARKWGAEPGSGAFSPPFLAAWRRGPEPLLLLLETARSNGAAAFAVDGLKALFPDTLRGRPPAWLAGLCARPLAALHDLVVETLDGPAFAAAELPALGLHDAILSLIGSPSPRARHYALTYARAHSDALTVDQLVGWLDDDVYPTDVVKFASIKLTGRSARALGLDVVLRLLRFDAPRLWARKALSTEFEVTEFSPALLAELVMRPEVCDWGRKFVAERFPNLPASFWIDLLHHPDLDEAEWDTADHALEVLGEMPLASLPPEFLLEGLAHDDWGYQVAGWVESADTLPAGLDVERVKGLVFDPATREVAFTLLGNARLFTLDQIEVSFVLALARRADPTLHRWAHEYLIENAGPEWFADTGLADDGVARLFALATGPREPATIRAFAQAWLTAHHPSIGRQPGVPREAYTADRVWPALWDDRPDVRRFGVDLARADLARWGAPERVYDLGEAPAKEVRNVAYDALLHAGDPRRGDAVLPIAALDPARVFGWTESSVSATRDVAMTLIRKHYDRLGGAQRLGWLMASTDREVRMYAVRLLWERHRPRAVPDDWAPHGKTRSAPEPFTDGDALCDLLRRLLFAVPPARGAEKGSARRGPRLPANVAKRRIIEVVRDFGVEDRAFAERVAPVLAEFTGSLAKGEWQTCLSALLTLQRAHGFPIDGLEGRS